MKIHEVIEAIISSHQPLKEQETCDTVKYGNPDKACTGVALTCFASADVIRKSAELGANLIICHEPLFYNHMDETDWLVGNLVFAEKTRLLDETGVVVWRDHDYIHSGGAGSDRPFADGIFYGIMKELGWEDYLVGSSDRPKLYQLPEVPAEDLARELIRKLGLRGMRIVGDRNTTVSKVLIAEHVLDNDQANGQIQCTDAEEIDALIPLELIDWTLSAYVRDSAQLGRSRIIYSMGHFNVEELGMKYMARWLPGILGGDIPVHYIQSGDSFDYII